MKNGKTKGKKKDNVSGKYFRVFTLLEANA